MALMVHRFSLEYFLAKDLNARSKKLAKDIFFSTVPNLPARSIENIPERRGEAMQSIETWLTTAYRLRVAVELSVKQYRTVNLSPGQEFDDEWMIAEELGGTLVDKALAKQAPRRVAYSPVPALAQL
jgi:hypothetical protein